MEHIRDNHKGNVYSCDENSCNYKGKSNRTLRSHKLIKHSGLKIKCAECDFTSSIAEIGRKKLKVHVSTLHKGIPLNCTKCEYSTLSKGKLKMHKLQKHGKRHYCDKCEYNSYAYDLFKEHTRIMHEPNLIKLKCKECEYKTATKKNLDTHIKALHKGVRFLCNQCEYKATRKQYLNSHMSKIHNKEMLK